MVSSSAIQNLLFDEVSKPYSIIATILEFFCLVAKFKNEVKRANFQENQRILNWLPFWNEVYLSNFLKRAASIFLIYP